MKAMSKKVLSLTVAAVMTVGVLAACGKTDNNTSNAGGTQTQTPAATAPATNAPKEAPKSEEITGTVTASGSTALLPLVKAAGEQFMAKHPKATINVSGGGSGTGVKNVAEGTSDIGNSDVAAAAEYADKGLKEHIVAIAAFALVVNNDVNVESLTKQQAADIYSGKIKNWKEVGGKDLPITLIHRPDSSGSRKLVQQLVMEKTEFSKEGVTQESSGAMKTAVAQTSGAIGYIDTPYIDNTLKALKFEGVAFGKETIKNGTYKLYGQERMYTKGEPKGATKAFIDFIMADDFQNNQVEKLGFLPANLLKK
ncbi:phosphate ABC transporter substrate-binding protein [Paenibacillus chartarius]|uniref:Phosphate-binding protein n=1 Tax=Paenibacillus chartarius TaxID=747481 RepID=A0ABV6DUE7_9BACL